MSPAPNVHKARTMFSNIKYIKAAHALVSVTQTALFVLPHFMHISKAALFPFHDSQKSIHYKITAT